MPILPQSRPLADQHKSCRQSRDQIGLLSLAAFLGSSIADKHQRLIRETYQQYATFEETAHRLPHLLAKDKKSFYKLYIWAQIDADGAEVTSPPHAAKDNLDDVNSMLTKLEEKGPVNRLKEADPAV